MATKKLMAVLLGVLVISAWVFGSAIQAGAETLNYKVYTWGIRQEMTPIGDVEGHDIFSFVRGAFIVFENGEVATSYAIGIGEAAKSLFSFIQYKTWTFADGSTMIIKTSQGTAEATGIAGGGAWKSEIIKGTGRFEGIKGTESMKIKYLPLEKGEAGQKGYGDGTITYTLPSK